MNTKIVYVVTSTLDDVYWEEAWVSVWSARYHHPDAHITLVCDKETLETVKNSYREKSLNLFDETITVDFGSLLPLFFKRQSLYQYVDKLVHSICKVLYRLYTRV